MTNVLFLTHFFPPEIAAGANRTYEHIKRWQKKGVDVTVITNYPNHPRGKIFGGYKNKLFTKDEIDGIKVIRVKTISASNNQKIKRALNFIFYFFMSIWASFRVKNVDVIIATSPQFLCGFAGSIIKKFKRKPFILEIRDLWPDSITAVGALKKDNVIIKFLYYLEKKMYKSATQIIPLTDAFKQYMLRIGVEENKISVIPNSVDLSQVKNVIEVDTSFDKEDKFLCSYIGTFGLAHKLETILRTADLLRENSNIHFLLVGDGAEREKLIKMKSELNLANVTILPIQPKKNIPYFLKLSDVGLIVLRNSELFKTVIPSKIFEYMATDNAQILSMPKGATTDILNDGEFGLWSPPQDSKSLAEKILYLYKNKKQVNDMAKAGKLLVENYYNRDLLAMKMLDVIKKL
ncbi:MAG: glycosyltransferase family 4 protein [Candidatus Marinimicrobia bacterium]|nr:glycosyltransferase family 4 protein [Candidatus Neomarinimicrobiota bacterium]